MPYSTGARNAMLNHLGGLALFASLHSAYPGDTGLNEIAGGIPAYTREAIAWNAAASGAMTSLVNPTFDVPGSTTIAWMGLWSLLVGGTFYGSMPLGGTAGTPFYASSSDTITSDAHGLSDGDQVVVLDTNVGSLPTGLVEGTIYFVRDVAGDTFKLAATSGGVAINLTADGTGFVARITPETFGGQGTYATSSTTLDLLR